MDNEQVLFLCRANMGRSQVGAALYNALRPGMAESAGTKIEEISARYVGDWVGSLAVRKAMKSRGIDISGNIRRRITLDEAEKFGHVVVMAEVETRPLYLLGLETVEDWPIPDLKGLNLRQTQRVINVIDERVSDLIERIESNNT